MQLSPTAILLLAFIAAALCALAKPSVVEEHGNDLWWDGIPPNETYVRLNLPPRYMWGWGPGLHGYCGSCSTQTSALYFGTWISQEYVRYAAGNVEVLLLREHLDPIAETFKLNIITFDDRERNGEMNQEPRFLTFIQNHLMKGHPCVGGWFERNTKALTDSDYDHIMPMTGLRWTSYPLFSPAAVDSIYFNDLYLNHTRIRDRPLDVQRADYYTTDPASKPYDFALPAQWEYGYAMTGIMSDFCDVGNATYRTMLHASNWSEPDWGAENHRDETPKNMWFAATIFGLTPGKPYALLRFDGNVSIPTHSFLSSPYAERLDFVPDESVYYFPRLPEVLSKGVYSYRTVEVPQPPVAPKKEESHKTYLYVGGAVGAAGVAALLVSLIVIMRRSSAKTPALAEEEVRVMS